MHHMTNETPCQELLLMKAEGEAGSSIWQKADGSIRATTRT
jgi:hypothetical protein